MKTWQIGLVMMLSPRLSHDVVGCSPILDLSRMDHITCTSSYEHAITSPWSFDLVWSCTVRHSNQCPNHQVNYKLESYVIWKLRNQDIYISEYQTWLRFLFPGMSWIENCVSFSKRRGNSTNPRTHELVRFLLVATNNIYR